MEMCDKLINEFNAPGQCADVAICHAAGVVFLKVNGSEIVLLPNQAVQLAGDLFAMARIEANSPRASGRDRALAERVDECARLRAELEK